MQPTNKLCNGLLQLQSYCICLYNLRFLACPARFERATYALEAEKMRLNNSRNNGLSLAKKGVQYAPRTVARSGIGWMLTGIHRRSSGQTSNLSGKPTFMSILLNDGWVAAYDPKQTLRITKTHPNELTPSSWTVQKVGYCDSWWPGAESNQGLGCPIHHPQQDLFSCIGGQGTSA